MRIEQNSYARQLLLIMGANVAVLLTGVALAYFVFKHDVVLGLTLVLIAFITFFGLLCLPGAVGGGGEFRESRIRLGIAGSLLLVYLAYFGTVVFLANPTVANESRELLPTLTSLLSVVIPFYFGASAAVEIGSRLKKDRPETREKGS